MTGEDILFWGHALGVYLREVLEHHKSLVVLVFLAGLMLGAALGAAR